MFQGLGLLAIRGMLGWVMFFHGAQRIFNLFGGTGVEPYAAEMSELAIPSPEMTAYVVSLIALIGGGLLMLGLAARLAALAVSVPMFATAYLAHRDTFDIAANGMEHSLVLAVVALGLVLTGPGPISADALFRSTKPEKSADKR